MYSYFKFIVFILIIIFLQLAQAEEKINEREGNHSLTIQCKNKQDPCDFIATDISTKKTFKTKVILNPKRISFIWHTHDLLEMVKSFGTNDSASIFFDYKNLKISPDDFPDVIAVYPEKKIIAYSGVDDHDDDVIIIRPIFGEINYPFIIKRNFYLPPSISVPQNCAYFTKNNEFFMEYTAKEQGDIAYKKELIKLPSSFLDQRRPSTDQ